MLLANLFLILQIVSGATYTSYQNKIQCNAKSGIVTPKDLKELQSIVNNAISSGTRVKVIGSRHSITDTICTDGIPIHLANFQNVSFNETEKSATIGAGMELLDAMNALKEKGYTINHIPSFGGITVGGAAGLGAHGSSLTHPNNLSEFLVGLTIIDGNGQLRKIQEGDEDFDSFRVHLGLLGVVVDATFKVEPLFKMTVHNYRVKDDVLINNSDQLISLARQNDWFQFWWFPTDQGLVISEGKYVDVNVAGDAETNLITNSSPFSSFGKKVLFEFLQLINNTKTLTSIQNKGQTSLYEETKSSRAIFTENGKFINPATGYNYRMMTSRCDDCPWEVPLFGNLAMLPDEYSVAMDLHKLPEVVADLNKLFAQYPTPFPLIGLFFRFSQSTKGVMSLSQGQDTFHIDWTFPMRLNQYISPPSGISVMQSMVQLMVFKHGGRPHWGKNGLTFFSNSILSERYNLEKFKATAAKYDPNGLFRNKFGNRILGNGPDTFDIPSKVTHCALQDYCLCNKNNDCAFGQKCGSLIGYPVCV